MTHQADLDAEIAELEAEVERLRKEGMIRVRHFALRDMAIQGDTYRSRGMRTILGHD